MKIVYDKAELLSDLNQICLQTLKEKPRMNLPSVLLPLPHGPAIEIIIRGFSFRVCRQI